MFSRPSNKLEVGQDNAGVTLRLSSGKLPDGPEDIGTLNKIQFTYRKNRSGGAAPRLAGYIASRTEGAFYYNEGDHDSALDFATVNNAIESVKMTIDNTGNVVIGTLAGGDGSSYVCVDASGVLFSQEGAC